MTQFQLDQYARYREKAQRAVRAKELCDGRYYLLLASKYLLEAAKRSPGNLRKIRWEKGLRLKNLALSLHEADDTSSSNSARRTSDAAEDKDLTPSERWILSEKPDVRFDQIAGLSDVKEAINLRVILPIRNPEVAGRFRKSAGGGILLYGPPGTGKTMLAKAVATELDAQFLNVKSSNVMSQWVGVAERNLAKLFELARSFPVSVVFLDEVEALVGKRGGNSTVMNRVIPEFLSQVDGLDPKKNCILLLGATNRPWDMDEAALRPGRFGERFYVGLPDDEARTKILNLNLEGVPMEDTIDLAKWGKRLEGYSGADLVGVCQKATDYPFHRQIRSGADMFLSSADLERAVQEVGPTVGDAVLKKYQRFAVNG